MTKYLGYIALIPRNDAVSGWLSQHLPRMPAAVLEAFCSDKAWIADERLRHSLRLSGGVRYTAWQYATFGSDTLVVVCEYSSEGLAPGGKFAADVQNHEGADLTELTEEEILVQVKRALEPS
jgi:hypothetical protein